MRKPASATTTARSVLTSGCAAGARTVSIGFEERTSVMGRLQRSRDGAPCGYFNAGRDVLYGRLDRLPGRRKPLRRPPCDAARLAEQFKILYNDSCCSKGRGDSHDMPMVQILQEEGEERPLSCARRRREGYRYRFQFSDVPELQCPKVLHDLRSALSVRGEGGLAAGT